MITIIGVFYDRTHVLSKLTRLLKQKEKSPFHHQRATTAKDKVVAQRCFETCIDLLCAHLNRRLVFVFDQFDHVWKSLPDTPFLVLRALRDEFKYWLSFIVATRDELSRVRESVAGCQDFYEHVSLNTYGLGPHSEADAQNQVERLAARRGQVLDKEVLEELMRLTGRHPGLRHKTLQAGQIVFVLLIATDKSI